MRKPRLKRPADRNVVSMRDWQKMTGQKPVPPKLAGIPLWLGWAVLAAIAAALTWMNA